MLTAAERAEIDRLSAALPSVNHYDLLGIPRDADTKAIKRAHCARIAQWHPDRWFDKPLGPYRAMLNAIVQRLNEARDALGTRQARARYDATLPPLPAPRARMKSVEELLEETMDAMRGESEAARRETIALPTPPTAPVPFQPAGMPTQSDIAMPATGRATAISTDAVVVDAPGDAVEPPAATALPRRRGGRRVASVAGAFLALTVVAGAVLARGWRAAPHDASVASPAPIVASPPVAPPPEAVPATPPPSAPIAAPAPIAIAAPAPIAAAAPLAPQATPTTGRIQVTSVGRRVFLDGRLVGQSPQLLTVSCGRHKLQVGSSGKPQSVDVQCGADLVIGKKK